MFCAECNNGWMSELEASVVDTVEALANRSTDLDRFSGEARAALARWTLKTGLAIYHSPGIRPPSLDRSLYDAAYHGRWPLGAVAFLVRLPEDCGAYPALNCNFARFHERPTEEFEWEPSGAFAAGAVYRDLMIGLAYMDPRTTTVGLVEGIHWPFRVSERLPAIVGTFYPLRHPEGTSFFDMALMAVCAIDNGTDIDRIAKDFRANPHATPDENTKYLWLFESLRAANA